MLMSSVTSAAPPASIKTPTTKLLSMTEIADHRAKGLRFKCDEKFKPGHKEECKRLLMIMVLDNGDIDHNDHFTRPT
jgi:hypothetical protein